jgi:hypothetical protein
MFIPPAVLKTLEEKKIKLNPSPVIFDGKTKMTVAFDRMDYKSDLTEATAIYQVVSKEKPQRTPRAAKQAKPAKK